MVTISVSLLSAAIFPFPSSLHTPNLVFAGNGVIPGHTRSAASVVDIENTLLRLYKQRITEGDVSISEMRDPLRRAAALLCDSDEIQPSIIRFLVGLPFEIFTEESIDLGISLWLGVINENPRAEPRILVEVEQEWEKTIQRRKGLFDPLFE